MPNFGVDSDIQGALASIKTAEAAAGKKWVWKDVTPAPPAAVVPFYAELRPMDEDVRDTLKFGAQAASSLNKPNWIGE